MNCGSDGSLCIALIQQLSRVLVPRAGGTLPVLARFVEKFLLECNTTAVRWQAHALILSLYNYSAPPEKQTILGIMWGLWRKLADVFAAIVARLTLQESGVPVYIVYVVHVVCRELAS